MNWPLLAPLLISTLVAILGWFFVHKLSAARDRENERRKIRFQFLLDAYRRLEAASNRGQLTDSKLANDFESAIADIQLLGSSSQVVLAKEMAYDIASQRGASCGQLLLSLRNELRGHLGLEVLDEEPVQFRLTPMKM